MDILLLGGTGHIGSRVRTEALDRGHRVTAVARNTGDLDSTDALRVEAVDAGSLKVDEDTELLDTPDFPEEYRDEAEAGRKARDRARDSDANWTVLCPPIVIEPGERTGAYRVGDDYLLTDEDGESTITTEDFAVALVDEFEEAAHEREQFTVAY